MSVFLNKKISAHANKYFLNRFTKVGHHKPSPDIPSAAWAEVFVRTHLKKVDQGSGQDAGR
jgi:hypothetical protein